MDLGFQMLITAQCLFMRIGMPGRKHLLAVPFTGGLRVHPRPRNGARTISRTSRIPAGFSRLVQTSDGSGFALSTRTSLGMLSIYRRVDPGARYNPLNGCVAGNVY